MKSSFGAIKFMSTSQRRAIFSGVLAGRKLDVSGGRGGPDPHKVETGVECSVKIGRKIWPGRVAAVGKFVVLCYV